jgi:hypothetical protein
MSRYYFVRVNGRTKHNNPEAADYYVPGEPPQYPACSFNYLGFCFQHQIVRIGWPDTGDLSANGANRLARGYDLTTVKPHERTYLEEFRRIQPGSVVLVPDSEHSGDLYIGTVNREYRYHHDVPAEPYECAHRVGVEWDRDRCGSPRLYRTEDLGISKGGFWRRAFQALDAIPTGQAAIPHIEAARASGARLPPA